MMLPKHVPTMIVKSPQGLLEEALRLCARATIVIFEISQSSAFFTTPTPAKYPLLHGRRQRNKIDTKRRSTETITSILSSNYHRKNVTTSNGRSISKTPLLSIDFPFPRGQYHHRYQNPPSAVGVINSAIPLSTPFQIPPSHIRPLHPPFNTSTNPAPSSQRKTKLPRAARRKKYAVKTRRKSISSADCISGKRCCRTS